MDRERILLVDDAEEIHDLVLSSIGSRWSVAVAPDLARAKLRLETENFDLILLDIGLPDGEGFRLCPWLRGNPELEDIPIFFLSGRTEIDDKVMAFSLGGADYVVKPFEPRELEARIGAILAKAAARREAGNILRCGALRVDLFRRRVYRMDARGEGEIHLTALEFELMTYFALREGHVLTRGMLIEQIWGNTSVTGRTVDTHICNLRRKLSPLEGYIQSVRGVGYVFGANNAAS